jgi:hypothetical protein
MRIALSSLLLISFLSAESLENVLDGFDDEPVSKKAQTTKSDSSDDVMDGFDDDTKEIFDKKTLHCGTELPKKDEKLLQDFTGKVTQQVAYSYSDDKPHDEFSSLKSSLLLDYEYKFDNGFKFKTNAKAYYDAIYDIRGSEKYSSQELDELRSEIELFDAYVEGSLSDNLDIKLGRQVVVWGRSDTIRVTDVLNPLDNRRPGMVDIEDLRLPVTMAKFDYFVGDWRITPIAVLEQRFDKNPPFGSTFNPAPQPMMEDKESFEFTPALSIGGEFSGWDINFYSAQIAKTEDNKADMFGTALNILNGSWLLKSEFAYIDNDISEKTGLLGLEYNGISDTLISYDIAVKKIDGVDDKSYQHALRISSDFMNATLTTNYLISLFGSSMDEGGFQRAWIKYDISDGIYTNLGVVDYIGGSNRFDLVSDNDMLFADITYSF